MEYLVLKYSVDEYQAMIERINLKATKGWKLLGPVQESICGDGFTGKQVLIATMEKKSKK
jgi:hypothetical protein